MKNVKSVQAVSYAAADAIIAGYRKDPACKPLTDDLTGWTLGKEIHRDDVGGAGVWRVEKWYTRAGSPNDKTVLLIGSGGEHTAWHTPTEQGYKPGADRLLLTCAESLYYLQALDRLQSTDPKAWF